MNTAAVKCLHAPFGRTRVVVLDKAVVETLENRRLAQDLKIAEDVLHEADGANDILAVNTHKKDLQMENQQSCQG